MIFIIFFVYHTPRRIFPLIYHVTDHVTAATSKSSSQFGSSPLHPPANWMKYHVEVDFKVGLHLQIDFEVDDNVEVDFKVDCDLQLDFKVDKYVQLTLKLTMKST